MNVHVAMSAPKRAAGASSIGPSATNRGTATDHDDFAVSAQRHPAGVMRLDSNDLALSALSVEMQGR